MRRRRPWRTICLGERSKDFEVAAWLTEALVRLDGLPGLSMGAKLISGLLGGGARRTRAARPYRCGTLHARRAGSSRGA
ncbi:hypothetical protein GXW71_29840 [Roseomonas hellenica]|uniref:ImpA N-terminal domain-containing protein n=1 Tax=Plastoroseomonas hellenica TaxID=2687306 RepID=A0ABS5F7Y0_9PROT|nr:type VI secretion system ImpA family N-terminal domain-containing protein [Plastoroseomonas hellenica]MBR0668591.1 hypothetical protein [Plastoroseomonas hellenica]